MSIASAKLNLGEVKKLIKAADSIAAVMRKEQGRVADGLKNLAGFVKSAQASLDESGLRENLSPEMIRVLREVYTGAFATRDRTLELLEIIVLDMRYVEAVQQEFKKARKETRDLPPREQPKVLAQLDKGLAAADRYYGILKEARKRGEAQLRTLDMIIDLAEQRKMSAIAQLSEFSSSTSLLALALFTAAVSGPAGLAFIGIAWPIIDFVFDFLFGIPTAYKYIAGKFRD